jgi:hypothetical protein
MEKKGWALVGRPRLCNCLRRDHVGGHAYAGGTQWLRFRRLRKAIHTHLQPKAAGAYQRIQIDAAKEVVLDILNDPKDHARQVLR